MLILKLKKSMLLTKLVLLILAVYATITLLSVESSIQEVQAENSALQTKIDTLTQQNEHLSSELDRAGSREALEDVARNELGYVYSGEIIFRDMGD